VLNLIERVHIYYFIILLDAAAAVLKKNAANLVSRLSFYPDANFYDPL